VHQFVFDDLVRPFLVANDLTDAIEIALEQIDSNDEREPEHCMIDRDLLFRDTKKLLDVHSSPLSICLIRGS
jgi:hypothetical protein